MPDLARCPHGHPLPTGADTVDLCPHCTPHDETFIGTSILPGPAHEAPAPSVTLQIQDSADSLASQPHLETLMPSSPSLTGQIPATDSATDLLHQAPAARPELATDITFLPSSHAPRLDESSPQTVSPLSLTPQGGDQSVCETMLPGAPSTHHVNNPAPSTQAQYATPVSVLPKTTPLSSGNSSPSSVGPISFHDTVMPSGPSALGSVPPVASPSVSRVSTPVYPKVAGYEILGELGRGGMGVVYKARQAGLTRVVALKMIRAGAGAGTEEIVRFRIEAEAVARLQHPNIVQIFDVGEQSGSPYFSLEFVDGGSLQGKLNGNPMPGREAARIVEQLARAMHEAHSKGIIHRDLKPANVLMTRDGLPKITDFGLAKDIGEETGQTQSGAIMGTPSYMAPEQAQGKTRDIGPSADIYSLGAILYDLLTARPPFKGETVLDTLQLVQSEDPVPPARLQPKVPRDLEIICLKCLQKEAAKRYRTAGELADDLARFLAGEPIHARAVSPWERGVKWARRRPAAAALALAGVLMILALIGGGWGFARYESRRATEEEHLRATAEKERGRAEDNFRQARLAVEQMLTEVGQTRLAHIPQVESVRRELLQKALHFYEGFLLKEKSDDPEIRWETGRAYLRVGDIQELLGQHADAEKAYRTALGFLEGLAAAFPDKAEYRHDLAAAYNNLGNVLKDTGRADKAEEAHRAALAARQRLADEQPQTASFRHELATSYNNLAVLQQTLNHFPDAEKSYRQAQAIYEQLLATGPQTPEYAQELARTQNNLGQLFHNTGRSEAAAQAFRDAQQRLAQLVRQRPGVPDYRQDLAVSYNHLGNLLRDTDPGKAEEAYREALKLRTALAADFPMIPLYRQELAAAYNNRGILLQASGKAAEAEQAYREALALKEKLAADFPNMLQYQRDLAGSYNNRGILLQTRNNPGDAEAAYRKGLALFTRLADQFPNVPDYRQELARTHLNLATLLLSNRRAQDAEAACRKALAVQKELAAKNPGVPEYQQELARGHRHLATLLQLQNKMPDAEKEYRQSLDLLAALAARHPGVPDYRHQLAETYNNLSNLLRATGRGGEAEKACASALDLFAQLAKQQPAVPVYRFELARAHNERAILLASSRRLDEAEKSFRAALALQTELAVAFPREPSYRQELGRGHNNLGILLAQLNQLGPSEAAYREAVAVQERLTQDYPGQADYLQDLILSCRNLAALRQATASFKEAEQDLRRTLRYQERLTLAHGNVPELKAQHATQLQDLARLLRERGRAEDARPLVEQALKQRRAALQAKPKDLAYLQDLAACTLDLAETLVELEDHAAAAAAVADFARIQPTDAATKVRAVRLLARCVTLADQDEEADADAAESYARQATALIQQIQAAGYPGNEWQRGPEFEPLRRHRGKRPGQP